MTRMIRVTKPRDDRVDEMLRDPEGYFRRARCRAGLHKWHKVPENHYPPFMAPLVAFFWTKRCQHCNTPRRKP